MEKFETGVVVRCREWEEIEVQKVRDAREGREADGSGCAHAKKGEADVKGKKTVRDVGHVGNVNFGKGDSGTVGTAHAPSVSTPATTPARTAPARTESTADLAKPLPPTPTPTPLRSSSRHSRSTTIGVTPSHPSHPSLHRAASPAAEPVLVDPVEPRPMSAVADIVSGDPPPIVMGTDTDADPGVLAVPTSADAADHLSVPTSGELDNSSEEYFTDARASSSSPTNLSSVSIDAPSTIIAPLSHMSTVPPESHVYHRDPSTVPRRSFADIVPFESMSLPRGGEGV
ncbi:hypothetical protein M427DRAFT_259034 [Gonapodya prolifera JEL478]|uniref:Uncharacterized protein n=1 Tax=Gonapodya prolifera (strain JEL478) TaxID=1344416 RepID=A0A139AKG9_GONPJ|nr:hypothetical protein M427DRAFT_259034 [Gonapodya prolifera JEL478]|eukprot:KXS17292.1 hypothetical protein M427DRAFT_259034 [Gonapodya prolifera JEL478]